MNYTRTHSTLQWITDVSYAIGHTLLRHGVDFLISGLILRPAQKAIATRIIPPNKGAARLITARYLSTISSDGAVLDSPISIGYAKFAIRKGLPLEENQKFMGVENEPHLVDDFDGVIKEGYGKGIKTLVWAGNAVIKIGSKRHIGRINIHQHDADRAGRHFDFVAEGVSRGVNQFEVDISTGKFKGRYAFIRPEGFEAGAVLITRMKDRGIIIPKPRFINKSVDFLKQLDADPELSIQDYIAEWKPDGSLANVLIKDNQAIFRSHRETGETYYDKLPAIESLENHSRLFTSRLLFRGLELDGTVFRGELFHPDGAARVGGILNSAADKAIAYQNKNGAVSFYAWDILKLKGKDISSLSYEQRRYILEDTISDIRLFNKSWNVVPAVDSKFTSFYEHIIQRPLPYGEGVVVKSRLSLPQDPAYKIKARDFVDLRIVSILEGVGKREGRVGRLVVESDSGGRGEIGSFRISDKELEWMWRHKDFLIGQVIEADVQEMTKSGAPRAGVFIRFHPSRSDVGLLMATEAMEGDEDKGLTLLYKYKTKAGWKRK